MDGVRVDDSGTSQKRSIENFGAVSCAFYFSYSVRRGGRYSYTINGSNTVEISRFDKMKQRTLNHESINIELYLLKERLYHVKSFGCESRCTEYEYKEMQSDARTTDDRARHIPWRSNRTSISDGQSHLP